jgi:hypothetical protein
MVAQLFKEADHTRSLVLIALIQRINEDCQRPTLKFLNSVR